MIFVSQLIDQLRDLRCPTAEVKIRPSDYDDDLRLIGVSGGLAGGVILETSDLDLGEHLPQEVADQLEELDEKTEQLRLLKIWADEALEVLRDHSARYAWADDLTRSHPGNEDDE